MIYQIDLTKMIWNHGRNCECFLIQQAGPIDDGIFSEKAMGNYKTADLIV
jgi:hypothetical protein